MSAGTSDVSNEGAIAINHVEENINQFMEDWGEEYNDLVSILYSQHLMDYASMFVSQGITLDIFLNLNEDDLCHIGMTNSKDRQVLLKSILELTRTTSKSSQEVCLSFLSHEEVSSIMASTLKHLTVIHASLAHTRLALHNPGVHNSLLNLEISSAEVLELLASEARIQAQLLSNQLDSLIAKRPAGEHKPKSRWRFQMTTMASVGLIGICAVILCIKKCL